MEEHQQVFLLIAEAATRGILYKNVFLKVLQNSQENICARISFLNKGV